jgi:hypothetical protein
MTFLVTKWLSMSRYTNASWKISGEGELLNRAAAESNFRKTFGRSNNNAGKGLRLVFM